LPLYYNKPYQQRLHSAGMQCNNSFVTCRWHCS